MIIREARRDDEIVVGLAVRSGAVIATEITLHLEGDHHDHEALQTLTAVYPGVLFEETIVGIETGIVTEIVTGTGTEIATDGIASVNATETEIGTETEITIVIVLAETMMTSQKWTLTATCRVAAD